MLERQLWLSNTNKKVGDQYELDSLAALSRANKPEGGNGSAFEDSFVGPFQAYARSEITPIDMYQTANEVVLKAALPEAKPEEVDITITGNTLTIQGETKADEKVKQEDYYYHEQRYGAFSRSIALPQGLNTEKTEANFEDGVLTLTIPKSEQVKPKQIKVKTKKITEGRK